MKIIQKIIIICCLFLISNTVQAHQPDLSSTMLVEQGENQWVLQLRGSLTAFEYEIEAHFGKDSYKTPEEFKEQVLQHVRSRTAIEFNDKAIVLDNGIVNLGHETSVIFAVKGTPTDIQSLKVQNTSFSDISRNQSALILIKKGFTKEQFKLDSKNDHTAILQVKGTSFVLKEQSTKRAFSYWPLFFAGAILVGALIFFLIKSTQTVKAKPQLQNV